MRLTIESTQQIETLGQVTCRRWEGETETGIKCTLYVHRVSLDPEDEAAFDELMSQARPDRGMFGNVTVTQMPPKGLADRFFDLLVASGERVVNNSEPVFSQAQRVASHYTLGVDARDDFASLLADISFAKEELSE